MASPKPLEAASSPAHLFYDTIVSAELPDGMDQLSVRSKCLRLWPDVESRLLAMITAYAGTSSKRGKLGVRYTLDVSIAAFESERLIMYLNSQRVCDAVLESVLQGDHEPLDILAGFIAHEIAHFRYDPSVIGKGMHDIYGKPPTSKLNSRLNVIYDGWIENRLGADEPACKLYLQAAASHVFTGEKLNDGSYFLLGHRESVPHKLRNKAGKMAARAHGKEIKAKWDDAYTILNTLEEVYPGGSDRAEMVRVSRVLVEILDSVKPESIPTSCGRLTQKSEADGNMESQESNQMDGSGGEADSSSSHSEQGDSGEPDKPGDDGAEGQHAEDENSTQGNGDQGTGDQPDGDKELGDSESNPASDDEQSEPGKPSSPQTPGRGGTSRNKNSEQLTGTSGGSSVFEGLDFSVPADFDTPTTKPPPLNTKTTIYTQHQLDYKTGMVQPNRIADRSFARAERDLIDLLEDEEIVEHGHIAGRLTSDGVMRNAIAGDISPHAFSQSFTAAQGHGDIEIVIGYDCSGSMSPIEPANHECAYRLKKLFDSVGLDCTVIGWAGSGGVVFPRDEKLNRGRQIQYREPELDSGQTIPEEGSKIAHAIFSQSSRRHKLWLNMTDGEWPASDSYAEQMQSRLGCLTSIAFLPAQRLSQDSAEATFKKLIDSGKFSGYGHIKLVANMEQVADIAVDVVRDLLFETSARRRKSRR